MGNCVTHKTDRNQRNSNQFKLISRISKMDQAVFNDQKKEWNVDGVKDGNLILDQIDEKHAVCISKCQDTFIQIKGKVSHILLLNCKKVGLVFDTVVSSVEIMRCQSVEVQVMVDASMFSLERSESVTIYLNKESKDKARIVTNNSSLVSVGIPKENPEDGSLMVDVKSIVEQFVTSINKETGALETKPLDRKNDFMS